MKARALSLASGVLSTVGVLAFLAFGKAAERAMPKDGLGDPLQHADLSTYACVSFYLAAATWAVCILFSQMAAKPYRGKAIFWFGLVLPIVAVGGWVIGVIGA
jgi:hypothetical protein